MSDAKETDKGKKRLGLSSPGRLELNKTIEAGQVKQNFSHGRSKMVAVEKKRKRTFVTDPKGEMSELQELMHAFGAQKGVRFTAPEYVDPETGEITK